MASPSPRWSTSTSSPTPATAAASTRCEGDPRHVFVQGDIQDGELVGHLLREHDINAVMHLAAESHVDRSIDSPERVHHDELRRHLPACSMPRAAYHKERQAAGTDDFRFLHVSTDEVFGSLGPTDPAFSETTPYAPNSPYSASKAGSDHLARAYVHTFQLPVVTTNCSNNYGPFQFPEKLMPLMIQKVIRGEKLPVYGDGSNVRDWLYVEDHCRGLTLAVLKGEVGETYNIGGKCEMKNIDVVHAIIAAVNAERPDLKREPEDLITFVKDRPGHDRRYAIDCSKIGRELGWEPRETFDTGMRKTVRWYLDNAKWIAEIEHKVSAAASRPRLITAFRRLHPFHPRMKRPIPGGLLIAVEGIDGAGKTTVAATLAQWCGERGLLCALSKEPTSLEWGRKLRESAATGRLTLEEELDMFHKDREDHVAQFHPAGAGRGRDHDPRPLLLEHRGLPGRARGQCEGGPGVQRRAISRFLIWCCCLTCPWKRDRSASGCAGTSPTVSKRPRRRRGSAKFFSNCHPRAWRAASWSMPPTPGGMCPANASIIFGKPRCKSSGRTRRPGISSDTLGLFGGWSRSGVSLSHFSRTPMAFRPPAQGWRDEGVPTLGV